MSWRAIEKIKSNRFLYGLSMSLLCLIIAASTVFMAFILFIYLALRYE